LRQATIICADVLDALAEMDDCAFDACLTDPPYGLGFMGKRWDQGVPSGAVWREVCRVLKPGAMLLAFGGTRTHHRLMVAIEDAGFEIRDCLMWLYGSGFPKSLDISKAIDKAAGAENIVGTKPDRWTDKGLSLNFATDRPQAECKVTAPATPAARQWQGYGTALKPAWEPVVLAMKPVDGTFAENALRWGVAGLAIDAGRIAAPDNSPSPAARRRQGSSAHCKPGEYREDEGKIQSRTRPEVYAAPRPGEQLGRFPANVLLDEEAAAMLDGQAGWLHAGMTTRSGRGGVTYCQVRTPEPPEHQRGTFSDSGGPSRFFYTAKASSTERGDGNVHPTVKPVDLDAYLSKLILPPERAAPRRLLVPFCGSGSEIIGALRAGWDECVGIELEPEYVEIAGQRIEGDAPLLNEVQVA
jgi:site-specific DNA-methyltransferase (adenine-specific)